MKENEKVGHAVEVRICTELGVTDQKGRDSFGLTGVDERIILEKIQEI
jgi:hypothetical protein